MIDNRLIAIASFVDQKNFDEGLKLLQELDVSELSDNSKHFYYILELELNLSLGRGNLIDNGISDAIEYYRYSENHEHFARAKYLYGWQLQQLGRLIEAREAVFEAYLIYKRYNKLQFAARVLNRLAYIQFQLGSIEDSIRNFESCSDIYQQLGDLRNNVTARFNICLIRLKVGLLDQALKTFAPLANDIVTLKSKSNQCHYFLAYGMALALKDDFSQSLSQFKAAESLLINNSRDHVNYLEYLGWLKLLEGKLSEAEKNLTEAVNMGLRLAPESDLVSQTRRLLADVYIAQGKFGEAKKTGAEALAVAEKIGERAEIAGAHRALAQCACHEGDAVEAREHYFQALNIYQGIDYRYELSITRYLAALTGLYDKTESSAMLYLAAEYFRSEDISGWLARVEQARARFPGLRNIPAKTAGNKSEPVFIAVHPLTRKALETAETIAPTDMTILLTGPTGVGKDRLAEYIHHFSGRTGKFISLNCAAIPDSMIEAELFGHCRGAFTGAGSERVGLFEESHGGTLYLNEIADASPEFQVKLLQAIENKKVRKIGSNENRSIDIRIMAATNQDLKELISARKFRPDLYYRLNEVVINLPALSDRIEDIPALTACFLQELGFTTLNGGDTLEIIGDYLAGHSWPGNVRELKAEIRRLWSMCGGCLDKIREILAEESETLEERLVRALQKHHGNKSAVARELGVSEGTVRNYIKRSGVECQAN